jgi:hypothetical protein
MVQTGARNDLNSERVIIIQNHQYYFGTILYIKFHSYAKNNKGIAMPSLGKSSIKVELPNV